ncbi:uncharacterized protein RAG0_16081 [Rhynchosporium agropyri]|uniref:Uncharacterized protein n=1 Tax=Rhynchosporium agropyri TaxID=914238 RepID=A0A1E1LNT1_9HELO|nr:uncharacterized protein RAG0_16081 [Rhynchosporium agropyri]
MMKSENVSILSFADDELSSYQGSCSNAANFSLAGRLLWGYRPKICMTDVGSLPKDLQHQDTGCRKLHRISKDSDSGTSYSPKCGVPIVPFVSMRGYEVILLL